MPVVTLKRCTKCGEEKPATAEFFRRNRRMLSGFDSWCRDCYRVTGRKRAARYRQDHHAECLAKQRAWFEQHPERAKFYTVKYRQKRAEHRHQRRARLLGATGTHTAADVRAQYERQHGHCFWCGAKVTWRKKHIDHVIPLALGGSNGPENLVIACPSCNLAKGARHPMDFAGRML